MTEQSDRVTVSVIVPTIGRPESLRRMLLSLLDQSYKDIEVLVADGSSRKETEALVQEPLWQKHGLRIERIFVSPPNAVSQRKAAIAKASGEFLLLLDDDVVLEPNCVEEMLRLMNSAPDIVGVVADLNNQFWPQPTRAWRAYLRLIHGLADGEWNGKVIGPLLRFGYYPVPKEPRPMEWLSTCNTMIRHDVYHRSGGFSNFFLHRCTISEDVDLGLKVARHGRILFCPQARLGHFQAPGGRVSVLVDSEDDLYNRFLILSQTLGYGTVHAFGLASIFFLVETTSTFPKCLLHMTLKDYFARVGGRLRALGRILLSSGRPLN